MGESRLAYRVLVGKPERSRPLEGPRCRWESNTKMDLREVEWGHGMDRCDSGLGQMAGCSEYGNKPFSSLKCGEIRE